MSVFASGAMLLKLYALHAMVHKPPSILHEMVISCLLWTVMLYKTEMYISDQYIRLSFELRTIVPVIKKLHCKGSGGLHLQDVF